MTQEIIGSEPSITEIKIIFEKELVNLLDKLKLISKENIENILEQQKICEKHVNTRPGAMALNQSKIEMFNDYNNKLSINDLFDMNDSLKTLLISYLEVNKVTKDNPNHVRLKFEKDSEKAKIISNVGDGKNYQLSFVIEEQQSAQEYKIFKFLTIFTVSFGLLIMLFIKRLKKLAHGAE